MLRWPTVSILIFALPAQSDQPGFATGDLTKLQCRVVAVDKVDRHANLLTIEVHNLGSLAAEPLQFRIKATDK